MGLWKNIVMARETMKILRTKSYCLNGKVVSLPHVDLEEAIECGGCELISEACGMMPTTNSGSAIIEVSQLDSFEAAKSMSNPLVLNFANAHYPGGGFKLGASSQEESLCRRSSLYLSLSSRAAAKMYRCNNSHFNPLESNWMILSPSVCVFRDSNGKLLTDPYLVAVISAPAPNRRGLGLFASRRRVREGLMEKIKIMLTEAYRHQYREIVLGAWGCGAFGNSPDMVAECFRLQLIDSGFISYFDKVVFAIKEKQGGRNFAMFREILNGRAQ